VRAVLDTSVLIAQHPLPADIDAAISVVSIAELHFGLLVAGDDRSRAARATRLGMIEARFPDPLALDDRVAREWGHLQAVVAAAGGQPRRRAADLAIAATAKVHDAILFTDNRQDFAAIGDLVDVRTPDLWHRPNR
jgi:predicted nucleic acid-binding protein